MPNGSLADLQRYTPPANFRGLAATAATAAALELDCNRHSYLEFTIVRYGEKVSPVATTTKTLRGF